MTQRTITIILVLIVVGGLAWFVNKTYTDKVNEPGGQSTNQNLQGASVNQSLFYVISGSAKEIWKWQNGSSKKAFTDSDEAEKILKISNLATTARTVLATTNSGKLEKINLDLATKQMLQNSYGLPSVWSVSQDGEDLATVSFSNTEEDYGYNLFIAPSSGGSRKKIANSSSEIRSPSFSSSKDVAFVSFEGTQAQIKIAKSGTDSADTLITFDNKTIDSLSWAKDGKIIFAQRNIGSQKGEIDEIDTATKLTQKIIDFSGGQVGFVFANVDFSAIAYLVAQYSGKIDDKTNGQIYVFNLQSHDQVGIGKANQILGWLPASL